MRSLRGIVIRLFFITFAVLSGILMWGQTSLCEVPEGYVTPRAMGLGGAFTAVSNDESAFWNNPAGIARVRKARSRSTVHILKFPNITAAANAASRSFYSTLKGSSDSSVADAIASGEFSDSKPFYARAAAFPVILFEMSKNSPAGFGVVNNSVMRVFIDKETPTDAKVSFISDTGANIGYAFTNFANRLNLGITLRPTYRYAYEDTIPSSELKSRNALYRRIKRDNNKGTGLGADIGAMFTLADFWFPTIGFTVRNLPTGCVSDYLNPFTETRQKICGTTYSGSSGNSEALSIIDPTDARVGFSISPRIARNFGVRLSADLQNLYFGGGDTYYGLPGIDFSKLIHGGMELFYGNPLERSPFAIQVGASQGFVTYGVAMNAGALSLEVASYATDISYNAKKIEDRRYVASLSLLL